MRGGDSGRRRPRRPPARKAEADPPVIADKTPHDPLTPLEGRCLAMCPPKEAAERARTKELSKFETQSDGQPVKKYRRPAAGRVDVDLAELRPSRVLLETLRHLLTKVLSWPGCGFDWDLLGPDSPKRSFSHQSTISSDSEQLAFLSLYHFIADRVRSVRQDFTIQRVSDPSAVEALERIARFHILASFGALRLLHSRAHEWSEQLNDQQLTSALAELRGLYARTQTEGSAAVSHQSEFVAYDILLHASDPRAVSLMLPQVPAQILQSPAVKRAWRAFVALQTHDFHQFFSLFEQSSVLEKRLLMKHMASVWSSAIHMVNKAFGKVDQFAMHELAQWMQLPSEIQARALCEAMNLSCFERPPPPAAPPTAESWENSSVSTTASAPSGYVKFKLTVLNEVLDKAAAQMLLRELAWKIHVNEIQASQRASDLINGPLRNEGH